MRRGAQVEWNEMRELRECVQSLKRTGDEIFFFAIVKSTSVQENICSLKPKKNKRKRKGKTIENTKRERKMTLGTNEKVKRCRMEKGIRGVIN